MSTAIASATAANLTDTDMIAATKQLSRSPGGISLRGGTKASPEKIDEASHDFEAQFISQMLSSMFSTESRDELAGSDSEDVYRSMLTTEYGKIMAKTGGIGIADQVKQMMLSQQEVEK